MSARSSPISRRGRTKRKVYFLTPQGEQKARDIREYANENEIDLTPLAGHPEVQGSGAVEHPG